MNTSQSRQKAIVSGSVMGSGWQERSVGARPARAFAVLLRSCRYTQHKANPLKDFTQSGSRIVFTVRVDCPTSSVKDRWKIGPNRNGCWWTAERNCSHPSMRWQWLGLEWSAQERSTDSGVIRRGKGNRIGP